MREKQIISGIKADALTKAAVLTLVNSALDKATDSKLIKVQGRKAIEEALTHYIPASRVATIDDLKKTAFNAFLIALDTVDTQNDKNAIAARFRILLLNNK